MELIVLAVVSIGVMVPLFVWAKKRSDAAHAAGNRAWAEAANALGGQFIPAGGPWYSQTPRRIQAVVHDVRVSIDHYEVSAGENTTITYTRAVTHARAPSDFRLKVSRAHAMSDIARLVGFQDVEVGDPHFDAAFVVKASDPEAACLWLSSTVRKHIWEADCIFEIKQGRTIVQRGELMKDSASLVALAHATAAFSDGRHRVMKAWKRLASQHGGRVQKHAERWAVLELEVEGKPMVIDTRKLGGRHFTFVTARSRGALLSPFVLANDAHLHQSNLPRAVESDLPAGYALWTTDPPAALVQLTPGVRSLISALGPAKLRVDRDAATVMWPGVSTSSQEMDRAVQLCAALASGPSRAPYR